MLARDIAVPLQKQLADAVGPFCLFDWSICLFTARQMDFKKKIGEAWGS
jgi:hypothetical protein